MRPVRMATAMTFTIDIVVHLHNALSREWDTRLVAERIVEAPEHHEGNYNDHRHEPIVPQTRFETGPHYVRSTVSISMK